MTKRKIENWRKVLKYLKKHDKGQGVHYEKILKDLKMSESDFIDAFEEGASRLTMYEVKPGVIKKL